MATRIARKRSGAITGNLRPADPFELIRWLARSQSDPRKALAELVQNSLDAAATRIQIIRARERGMTALHIVDDGTGVLPELSREEGLAYIATHIGHSRKRNLTPEQRRELMLQGKYGIGLLGFWSIGKHFEMRSQVNDSEPWVLRLTEDEPKFAIERLRGRLPLRGTWTEVVVRQLHRPAFVSLGARRIADYLAAELRGQLLSRSVTITVYDRIARGRAPKLLQVQPVRYPGQPLALPEAIDTPHGPLRIELYLLPDDSAEPGRVAVSCAGTVVYDDLCEFELVDFRHSPWSSGRLTGMLDFSGFEVVPGTRRGVLPNDAAATFATTVTQLEDAIQSILAHEQGRLASELEADLLKQLQRAFRDLPRLAPEYDFFAVRDEAARLPAGGGATSDQGGSQGDQAPSGVAESPPGEYPEASESTSAEEPAELFPPGPLATVEVVPPSARVPLLGTRRFRARPRAADGREIREGVDFLWACSSDLCQIEGDGAHAMFRAGEELETLTVWVVATQDDRRTSAEANVEVVEERVEPAPQAGIPQPEFVNEPTGNWRSRFRDGQWQVNAGHRDYLIAGESSRRKLRYLTALLAKEIVLHSFPHPQHAVVLERMIEVLTITERRLER
jgi:hypothetical protein